MKKSLIGITAVLCLVLAGCSGKGKVSEGPEAMRKIDPKELETAPVKLFADDWMLLAVGNATKMNAMTIGWGGIGQLWNMPVVTVYVSEDRYTKAMMDGARHFTISALPGRAGRDALVYLGTHSYRDDPDKIANAGLTVEYTDLGNPAFSEASLTIECELIYHDAFEAGKCPPEAMAIYESGLGIHSFYIGKIVNVYVREGADNLQE